MQKEGYVILRHFFTDKYMDELIEQLDRHDALLYDRKVAADFNLMKSIPFINNLVHSKQLTSLVEQVLGDRSFPINAFVLDKTKDSNWGLDWHQDLKIAVKSKIETVNFSHWTMESGIPHAIAPKEVLEKKLAVRIHLDPCFADNGAILIASKSHKNGIIQTKTALEKIISNEIICCEVEKGGIMFMTPLLLHKSPYSTSDQKRRILQIDYVGTNLHNGLEWYN